MNFCKLPKPEAFRKLNQCQIEELDKYVNLTQRILELSNVLELREQDYYERQMIQEEIWSLLREFYPCCQVYIFGSSINGMGCQGCDLDLVFIPFPGYSNEDFMNVEEEHNPQPWAVLRNPYLKKKLLSMSEVGHLKFVQKIMFTNRRIFEKIFLVPAKCPILNIKHKEFGIECDFSASNMIVTRNSELIRLYGVLDSRVRPIIILLRYWAKSLGFMQKNHLSSYAFCFMVIFALQNTDPPILPSVQYLSSIAGYSYRINGWETAFPCDVENIPKTENTDNIMELLLHIFDFYWNFDFVQNIVSPYFGKPWPISEMEKANGVLQSFPVSSFSIQDPFILNRNISRNASIMTAFKLSLLVAKELIKNDKFCLRLFFKSDYYQKQINSWHVYSNDMHYISKDSHMFVFRLTYDIISKSGLTNKNWIAPVYDKVTHVIYDVLQYGLLMECEIIDKRSLPMAPPKKKRKRFGPLATFPQLLISIQCTVYYDTWNSRTHKTIPENNVISQLDDSFSDALRKEHNISLQLVEMPEVIQESPLIFFQCNCFKYSEDKMSDLIIVLRPLTKRMHAHGLGEFLRKFIPKTVDKIFTEMQCTDV